MDLDLGSADPKAGARTQRGRAATGVRRLRGREAVSARRKHFVLTTGGRVLR